jgi:hypothetical protein
MICVDFFSPSKQLLRLYFTIQYNSYNFKIHYSNILSKPVQSISANVMWREANLVDLGLDDVILKRVLNRFDRCLWLLWTRRLTCEFHKEGNSFTSWTTIIIVKNVLDCVKSSHLLRAKNSCDSNCCKLKQEAIIQWKAFCACAKQNITKTQR